MTPQTDTGRILAIATAIVATLAVATSIWLNPPSENRARRLDLQRLQRLSLTESAIGVYFAAHTALPKTLEALDEEKNQLQHQSWHDPVTGEPFQYEILEEKRTGFARISSAARRATTTIPASIKPAAIASRPR